MEESTSSFPIEITAVVGWSIWDRLYEGKNHGESAVKTP